VQKTGSDGADVTCCGRLFQTWMKIQLASYRNIICKKVRNKQKLFLHIYGRGIDVNLPPFNAPAEGVSLATAWVSAL